MAQAYVYPKYDNIIMNYIIIINLEELWYLYFSPILAHKN